MTDNFRSNRIDGLYSFPTPEDVAANESIALEVTQMTKPSEMPDKFRSNLIDGLSGPPTPEGVAANESIPPEVA